MEEAVGPVSTCGRELLRGWRWPIDLMVSFTIVTASVSKILDTTFYVCVYVFIYVSMYVCMYAVLKNSLTMTDICQEDMF